MALTRFDRFDAATHSLREIVRNRSRLLSVTPDGLSSEQAGKQKSVLPPV